MRVRLTVNLGHGDAKRLAMSIRMIDDEGDVTDRQAAELLARGLAVAIDTEADGPASRTAPVPIEAVPPPPVKAVPARTTTDRSKQYHRHRH